MNNDLKRCQLLGSLELRVRDLVKLIPAQIPRAILATNYRPLGVCTASLDQRDPGEPKSREFSVDLDHVATTSS